MTDDILKLVRTVARLPRDDQNRLLRLVDLLSLAPLSVQHQTHARLRQLLTANPQSKLECVDGIDDLIDYLERAVTDSDDRSSSWVGLNSSMVRGTTQ